MISEEFFEGKQPASDLLEKACTESKAPREQVRSQLITLLEKLEGKGLIHGQ
jgi:hypothetical protein